MKIIRKRLLERYSNNVFDNQQKKDEVKQKYPYLQRTILKHDIFCAFVRLYDILIARSLYALSYDYFNHIAKYALKYKRKKSWMIK